MSATFYLLLAAAVLIPDTLQAKGKTRKVGDYFTLCSRNDPSISDCVKNSILEVKPRLIEGIPDLQLVPMDPLYIPVLEFKDGQGNFEFSMILKNVTIRGLKNFAIRSCTMDYPNHHLELDMTAPALDFEAQYEVNGKILVVPIQGNGDAVFNFTGVSAKASAQSKSVQRDGQEYIPIEEMKWTIGVEQMKSHFTNLFNGDKVLGDSTNKFLNENSKEAFETLKALPEEAFGQLFKEYGNKVFDRFPVDELFPK